MNEKHFILWTTQQGGFFKAAYGTREQYDEAVATRILSLPGPRGVEEIRVYFVAYGAVEDNFDFGLGSSREDAAREHATA